MRTLDERIESAEKQAASFAQWAQEEADQATGAGACGLTERAEKCQTNADRWAESADVWAATAGRLTAERTQRGYPDGWSAASEERRQCEATAYQANSGERSRVQCEAYELAELIELERLEALGLAPPQASPAVRVGYSS